MSDRLAHLQSVRVVLVNTSHPGNIGAAARAMKNMGLRELVLVEPQKYPDPQAVFRAANAADLLDTARVVGSLSEAVADCQLVVGTSARSRRIPWPLLPPRECAEQLVTEAGKGRVALVFGREDRGLTNEELRACQLHVHIPTNPDYSSLNLAMAVQVLAYELRLAALADGRNQRFDEEWDQPWATTDALEQYFDHLKETLQELGFLRPESPKQLMTRLRRVYSRTRLDAMEVNILRGILTSVQYHLKELKKHKDNNRS